MKYTEEELTQAFRAFVQSFGFLTEEEIDVLVENTQLRFFKKGHYLLEEAKAAKECYGVVKGLVREFYVVDGVEKTTGFFTEGQAVNSFASYHTQQAAGHFLVCAEDAVLTVGNQSLTEEMCERIPRLSEFIRTEVEKDAGRMQQRMAAFMTSSPEQRFLQLLEETPELINRVPQHQIASYLGITPESLSRLKKRVFRK